ncbi:MAG: transporter related protein [Polaromonas sp.]|nr:transporter related protein [Polaromonas sp.]
MADGYSSLGKRLATDGPAQAWGSAEPQMKAPRPAAADQEEAAVPLPSTTGAFIWRYVQRRAWFFGPLLALVVAGAACSVGVQYGIKLIVDTMASDDRTSRQIWYWLALFISLIAAESLCWRLCGWLGCRAIVQTGVDIRLDLFRHLSGHSLDYFSDHMAGSLGNRITATAGTTAAFLSTMIWRILPPCVDFVGALSWSSASTREWPAR